VLKGDDEKEERKRRGEVVEKKEILTAAEGKHTLTKGRIHTHTHTHTVHVPPDIDTDPADRKRVSDDSLQNNPTN
jgi:hypothetical protein